MTDYIVTVMAQDRVGIVRDISSALAKLCGNITHLSQTVVRGYFTLIISVEMPEGLTSSQIKMAVENNADIDEFEVNVRRYFQNTQSEHFLSEKYTLSMQGKDRPGIIAKTTSHLAERGVNILDFYSVVHNGNLLMLAQVSVPSSVDIETLRSELEAVGSEFGLIVHLMHENLFRATSEVRPVMRLRRDE